MRQLGNIHRPFTWIGYLKLEWEKVCKQTNPIIISSDLDVEIVEVCSDGCDDVTATCEDAPVEDIEILIENWGALWDIYAMSNHRKNDLGFNKEYLIDLYNSTGTCIQKELSKYYKCCFKEVENLWKL